MRKYADSSETNSSTGTYQNFFAVFLGLKIMTHAAKLGLLSSSFFNWEPFSLFTVRCEGVQKESNINIKKQNWSTMRAIKLKLFDILKTPCIHAQPVKIL